MTAVQFNILRHHRVKVNFDHIAWHSFNTRMNFRNFVLTTLLYNNIRGMNSGSITAIQRAELS